MKKLKIIPIIMLVLVLALTACGKTADDLELGDIKVPKEEEIVKPGNDIEAPNIEVTVNSSPKDENQNIGSLWIVNDGGAVKGVGSGIKQAALNLVGAGTKILYKTTDNEIRVHDIIQGSNASVITDEDSLEPYKLGAQGTYILGNEYNNVNYKVISGTNVYKLNNINKDLIMSTKNHAYLFDGSSLYRYDLKNKEETKIKVMLNGSEAKLKGVYDRYDSNLLEFFIGDVLYVANPSHIEDGVLEIKDNNATLANDIAKIFKSSETNGAVSFVYLSTDGSIKVYSKFEENITAKLPNIISGRLEDNVEAFYVAGAGYDDYMIYFTDQYTTYRYYSRTDQLFKLNVPPMTRLYNLGTSVYILDGDIISFQLQGVY